MERILHTNPLRTQPAGPQLQPYPHPRLATRHIATQRALAAGFLLRVSEEEMATMARDAGQPVDAFRKQLSSDAQFAPHKVVALAVEVTA